MKNLSTILILLAFLGLSMSSVFAQSTYVITGSGTQFTATKDGATVSNNQPIQTVIDAIKLDASGDDCTIQFGTVATLNTGTANITFDGGSIGKDWGLVTLTGKLTSASSGYTNGVVYMTNGVSINSQADITSTSTSDMNITLRNNSTGTLTISGGTVLLNNDFGMAIGNGPGQVHISGGVVEARGANAVAVVTSSKGKITVSGNAGITSSNINEFTPGTILIMDSEGASGTCLEITGGTVENTAPDGMAICNDSPCAINISGGTVSTTTGTAINNNSTGKITISGTALITSASINIDGGAIYFKNSGTETDVCLEITGGRIENTANGLAIRKESYGAIEMSGGTVSAIGYAVYTNKGTITISGGTVSSTTGRSVENIDGTINISGGTVSVVKGTVVATRKGTINISGGMVSTTTGYAVDIIDGTVSISGGMVSATTGYAVGSSSEGTITISGGILFAYGENITDVIPGSYDMSGNAVIVAWDEAAGTTTYDAGTSDDIFKLPATATAVWAKQSGKGGISVANEENIGFIQIEGVTVEGVGVEELTIDNGQLKIYPNPTSGQLTISPAGGGKGVEELGIKSVEVFDVYGKKISFNTSHLAPRTSINISHLATGIYFLKIATEAGEVVRKVVKN